MNLLERLENALGDETRRIDHRTFEECATALMADAFPSIVPIRGGSDDGRDADVTTELGATPMRVAVTSSRTVKGAKANLGSALSSLAKHGVAVDSIISVSLAELNQSRRREFEEFAAERGARLVHILDRAWFFDQLSRSGDWRGRLLGLRPGPYSLRRPLTAGENEPLVARDHELDRLNALEGDALVADVPGVGKSALASRVDGAHLVEGSPSQEQLLSDIVDSSPPLIVVDDAGNRLELLQDVVNLRRQEGLQFRLLATCWPHQVTAVRARIGTLMYLELLPLARIDMAKVVDSRGRYYESAKLRILEQAEGRPGWAIKLADLAKDRQTWLDVQTGAALVSEVSRVLVTGGLPQHSLAILGIVGLLGGVRESELAEMAGFLRTPRLDLTEVLKRVAEGGLIDVEDANPRGLPDMNYTVAPNALVPGIVSHVFFENKVPPVSPFEVFDAWPLKREAIVRHLTVAGLAGSERAALTARQLYPRLPEDVRHSFGHHSVNRYVAHLGPDAARQVLEVALDHFRSVDPRRTPETTVLPWIATTLLQLSGEVFSATRVDRAIELAAEISVHCLNEGYEMSGAVAEMVKLARTHGPDHTATPDALVELANGWVSWHKSEPASSTRVRVLVEVVAACMGPTFEGTWASVEDPKAITLSAGVLPASYLERLRSDVWDEFWKLDLEFRRGDLARLIKVAHSWGHVARSEALPFGATPNSDQVSIAEEVCCTMVKSLVAKCAEFPGLRAELRRAARGFDLDLDEEDDFLQVMFATRDPGAAWREWMDEYRSRVEAVIRPFVTESDPTVLLERLNLVKNELHGGSGWNFTHPVREAFAALAAITTNPEEWLAGAIAQGLSSEALPIAVRVLKQGAIAPEIVLALLEDPTNRHFVVLGALRGDEPRALQALIIEHMDERDEPAVWGAFSSSEVEPAIRSAVLSHHNRCVRIAAALSLALVAVRVQHEAVSIEAEWKQALQEVTLPTVSQFFLSIDALDAVAAVAPDTLGRIARESLAALSSPYSLGDLDALMASARILPRDLKLRVIASTEDLRIRSLAALALGRDDLQLLEELLSSGTVLADDLFNAVNGLSDTPSTADLAAVLVPHGVSPAAIAESMSLGSYSGDEVDRARGLLAEAQHLAGDPRAQVREVGNIAITLYNRMLTIAQENVRRRAVRGRL